MKAYLLLGNGQKFEGIRFGASKDSLFEVVFNTNMVGYSGILSNPAYYGLGVVMTYPLIGNYGICSADFDGIIPHVGSFIVREVSNAPSNFRCDTTLDEFMKKHGISGISGVDTRAITKIIRSEGAMNAMITDEVTDAKIKAVKEFVPEKAIMKVTTNALIQSGTSKKKAAVLNLGCQKPLLDSLSKRFGEVRVFNAVVSADDILGYAPDGIFLSDGPGNPKDYPEITEQIKKLYDSSLPIFAVGMGHLMLASAAGLDTERLPYGHVGASIPVRVHKKGKCRITVQNSLYTVTNNVNPDIAEISAVNVNDSTCEGLDYKNRNIISIQYIPVTDDTECIFDEFYTMTGGTL